MTSSSAGHDGHRHAQGGAYANDAPSLPANTEASPPVAPDADHPVEAAAAAAAAAAAPDPALARGPDPSLKSAPPSKPSNSSSTSSASSASSEPAKGHDNSATDHRPGTVAAPITAAAATTTTSAPSTTSSAPLAAQEPAPASAPSAAAAQETTHPASSSSRPLTPPPNPANNITAAEAAQKNPPVTPTAHPTHPPPHHQDAKGNRLADVTLPDAPDPNEDVEVPAHQRGHPTQMQQLAAQTPTNEHYLPSTPYTPTAAALDQHAYMMMALATMSAAPTAMSPPPTVTPSQVTLPNPLSEGYNGLGSTNNLRQSAAEPGLESFARIEFADSVFQMTTYAVIIGRDQRALEQARRDEKRAEEFRKRTEENASRGLPPPSPILRDRGKFSKSYVSEEGGMLGPESDSDEIGRPAKRRRTSTTGSSKDDFNENSQDNVISNRQYISHTPGAAAVDLASLRPSPWHVPFIGIHSPGPNIASKTKAISREHLKITYNEKEGVFEAIPLHKNGFFCEDVHYKSDKVVLKCGDRLQIKDIDFRFIINGVERGRTGAEEYLEDETSKKRHTHGGKEMSFDFEQSHGNGQMQDTSDELSDVDVSPAELSDLGEDDDDEGDEGEAAEEEDEEDDEEDSEGDVAMEESVEMKTEGEAGTELSKLPLPKKRGPGRPPKNGIMSKREQRLLKKQQQEMAKKTLPQAPPVEPPIKRKVGRPRKHPLPDHVGERPEKRKYKPRKPKNEDGAEGSDAERRAREKKEKKARPKSPPLELKIDDYTEGQLQKPNKNYGVLIDETLTAAGPDGLTLKQIYKRICQRYPWFYFHTETKGWESSVRHNLIGNEAFKKDETTNLWSRVPGVELDAGKKRKASSPDRGLAAAQGGYGPYSYPYNAPHLTSGATHPPPAPAPAPPGYPRAPLPGYQMPGFKGQPVHPAARPLQYAPASTAATQPVQPLGAPPPAPAQLPGYGPPPAPARPQVGAPQPSTYSSPYASRPPPPAHPAVKAEDGSVPRPSTVSAPPPAPAVAPVAPAKLAPGTTPSASQPGLAPSTTTMTTITTATAAAQPLRPVIDPRLLSAVVGLKNGLVDNLKKARNPKAEAIVMSALNRCIGLKKEATENDKMEAICIKGIRQVIDGFTKGKAPSAAGASDTPLVFEAKVLASLNGFKEISIKTLKARLGEGRAEAVTLSAIDRAIGLAEASIVPKPVEGEAGNLEGVEQHLMRSIRQLLLGMNQKLQ